MTNIINFKEFKAKKEAAESAADYPALECPACETECKPTKIDTEESVHYVCEGNGHRKLTWRINKSGDMMKGPTGNRFYR